MKPPPADFSAFPSLSMIVLALAALTVVYSFTGSTGPLPCLSAAGENTVASLVRLPAPPQPQSLIERRGSIDLPEAPARSLAFSPDGEVIAAASNHTVLIFDAKTGNRLRQLKGHTGEVTTVAFNPSSAVLASGSKDRTLRLWDARSGALLKVLRGGEDGKQFVHLEDHPVACAAFSPDGKRLLSCGTNNYVTFWDLDSGLWDLKVWTNHADKRYRDGCYHLAISRDGRHCAVAGGVCTQRHTRQVSLFQLDHGLRSLWNRGHDDELGATHVSFSADGSKLLSCGQDGAVRIWIVKTGELGRKLAGPEGNQVFQAALFTPDGKRVIAVTRSGTLCLWSAEDGRLLASTRASDKTVFALALAPNGTTLATSGEGGAIQLWSLAGGADDTDK